MVGRRHVNLISLLMGVTFLALSTTNLEIQARSFLCSQVGWFGDTEYCELFHVCERDGMGGFRDTIFRCPNYTVWCQESRRCEEQAVCPCNVTIAPPIETTTEMTTTLEPTEDPSTTTEFSEDPKFRTCLEIQNGSDDPDGINEIYPFGPDRDPIEVRCDFETDGGGWTIIQSRREPGPTDEFYLYWSDYEEGFGIADSNYWLGLQALHALTALSSPQELRVDLYDWENSHAYAHYTTFAVGASTDFYPLSVTGYSGDAGDSLSSHHGMKFSTRDMDNDLYPGRECAVEVGGAWWYNQCFVKGSSLNGHYYPDSSPDNTKGIYWLSWKPDAYYSLKEVELKIRDVDSGHRFKKIYKNLQAQ